jgi:hypothetical protein
MWLFDWFRRAILSFACFLFPLKIEFWSFAVSSLALGLRRPKKFLTVSFSV